MPKHLAKHLSLILLFALLIAACDDSQPTQVYQPDDNAPPVATVRIIDPNGSPSSGNAAASTPICKSTSTGGIAVGEGGCAKIDLPPGTPTLPLAQHGISVQGIRLEPGNTTVTAAPLKVRVKLRGEGGNLVVSASLRAVDTNGQPATYGDTPAEPVSMFPSMELGDWWEASTSAPTQPGIYYFVLDSQDVQRQKASFALRDAAIQVAADPHPLVGGFLISRNSNIWQVSPDAQRERQLSFYPEFRAVAKDAVWSPDGKQIAYAYAPPPKSDADEPQSELWLMQADGSAKHQLLAPQKDENFESPYWSPDGKYLYFDTMRFTYDKDGNFTGQSWQLERLEIATTKRELLLPNAQEPNLSDGKSVSYVEVLPDDASATNLAAATPTLPSGAVATPLPSGSERLMLANSDGSTPRQVVGSSQFVSFYAPKLSPDGKRIVFAAIGGPTDVQAICTSSLLATPTPQALRVNALAAPLYHGLPWDIWLVNSDGTGLTRLTQLNEDTPDVIWYNDSSHLAFIGITGLYTADLGSGCALTPLQTYNGTAAHAQLSWFAAK